jgi:hypothetical protein
MDIYSFLPKYPNINQITDGGYLNPYKENFYEAIFKKKEFYENKLEVEEPIPTKAGILLKHQKIIAKFLSSNTPYDSLLLVHEPGTGKTCSAIGTIENIKESGKFKGAIILAEGDRLLKNFKEELAFRCTPGQYIPEDYEKLSPGEKISRRNELIKPFYSFQTFFRFASEAGKMSEENIIRKYSNKIFVLDEVHHIRLLNKYSRSVQSTIEQSECKKYIDKKQKERYKCNLTISYIVDEKSYTKNIRKDSIVDYKKGNKIIIKYNPLNPSDIKLPRGKKVQVYENIKRVLQTVKNKKVLLLSGTPMKDQPQEIAAVLNLILPPHQELPVEQDFVDKYLIKEAGIYKVKENMKQNLKSYFKGRVSYLKHPTQLNISKTFEGVTVAPLKIFKVVVDNMSEFQTEHYKKAYLRDKRKDEIEEEEEPEIEIEEEPEIEIEEEPEVEIEEEPEVEIEEDILEQLGKEPVFSFGDKTKKARAGVYSLSRQATLFVFPDGSYGSKGLEKYAPEEERRKTIIKKGERKVVTYYPRNYNKLKKFLNSKVRVKNDTKQMLKNLAKYSSKYAKVIKNIIDGEKESCFVYCQFIGGSGIDVFSKILELFGFKKTKGNVQDKRPRYAIITGDISPKQSLKIRTRFNEDDNKYGEYIKVLIGSQVIGEGFTLKNVQQTHILTPWWNYSLIFQAIARTFRIGSHTALLKVKPKAVLKVYQHVSIPQGNVPSIDLIMYRDSEIKDVSIKRIERLLKESAFDCALTYVRNRAGEVNNSRECDYMDCNYSCDGMLQKPPYIARDLDYSTYNLYYSQNLVGEIIPQIIDIFQKNFILSLTSILDLLTQYRPFLILIALRYIINNSVTLYDKYGFECYLREENNIYFLVKSLSVDPNLLSAFYTEYPAVSPQIIFTELIDQVTAPYMLDIIKQFRTVEAKNREKLIKKLPLHIQEYFIEGSIEGDLKDKPQERDLRKWIKNYYKIYIRKVNSTWISSFLYDKTKILRCLDESEMLWKDCPEESIAKYKGEQQESRKELEDNPYGLYGVYDKQENIFKIRDVRDKEKLVHKDKRKRPKVHGTVCGSYTIPQRALMAVIVGLEYGEDNLEDKTKEELIKIIKASAKAKEVYKELKEEDKTRDNLRRLLYWVSKSKEDQCNALEVWFRKNELFLEI